MAKLNSIAFGLKRASFTLLRIVITLVVCALSPAILAFYCVMLLYRFVICKLARHLDPELGKMVSSIGNLFAAHDVYQNSYATNIALHVAGKIDKSHVLNAVEKIVAITNPEDGTLLYPELKQKLVRKFGFMFWKNVPDFKADSHVHYYQDLNQGDPDSPVTLQELRNVIGKFGKTPFDPSRAPCEVYIVKNLVIEKQPDVKSAIILRLHHCMFDGFAALNVIGKLVDNGPLVLAGQRQMESHKSPGWWFDMLLKPLMIILLGPYELVGQLLSFDNNELVKQSRREFKSEMRFQECEPFSLAELKEVKNHYKVTMSTLLTTILVGGVMKFMRARDISPDKIHMTFPLPFAHHPDKLRNYFSGGIISFDMRNSDRLKLLRAVGAKINRFRFSYAIGLPEMSMMLLRLLGSLPCFLVPKLDNVPLSSTMMHSSFPGPVEVGYFSGFPVVDATVGGSISKAYPLATLGFGYNGIYKLALLVDKSVLSQEATEEFLSLVHQEFCAFQKNMKEAQV